MRTLELHHETLKSQQEAYHSAIAKVAQTHVINDIENPQYVSEEESKTPRMPDPQQAYRYSEKRETKSNSHKTKNGDGVYEPESYVYMDYAKIPVASNFFSDENYKHDR